jgi:hypothetical protein
LSHHTPPPIWKSFKEWKKYFFGEFSTQFPNTMSKATSLCSAKFLISKVLLILMANKLVLDSITWSHFIFRFLKTFCEHAPWNKICGSTNFIIFGLTDQKLWMFEILRRSLGRVGMCWSQPARVDHMYKKRWVGGRRKILQEGGGLGHLCRAGRRPTVVRWP